MLPCHNDEESHVGSWELVYFVCVYLAVGFCLIAVIKIGIKDGWCLCLFELLTLIGFGVAYWLLESYALQTAPFSVYPPIFSRHGQIV